MLKNILDLIGYKAKQTEPIDGCCACCGEKLTDGGTKFNKLFSKSTFNQNHFFKRMESDYICNYCALFFKRENWEKYCNDTSKDPNFPAVEGKKRSLANWFFFSHAFSKNKHEIVKDRHRWRELLLSPPTPPFCFVISTMCKKHLIYRSEIAYCDDNYPIQFEEKKVFINKADFKKCLCSFEILYSMGLSKSSIRSGNYNSSALLKCDKKVFIENEKVISGFRRSNISYLEICEFIGMKNVP